MRRINTAIIALICIGVIGLCLNVALGGNTVSYLSKHALTVGTERIGYYYTFNFHTYIQNLNTSVSDISILELQLPTRQWNNDIINNLAVVGDYLILIANIILYPIRVFGYLLFNILAILGVNMDANADKNGLGWLITFLDTIINMFRIPYIS